MSAAEPAVGVVVLTQGTRPDDLRRAVDSVLEQVGVHLDLVVVGNGFDPRKAALTPDVKTLALPQNLGIPAGRNAGVRLVEGEYLLFVDDDASLASPTFVRAVADLLRADATIGLVQPRVVDPAGIASPRRWVPRILKGDPARSSAVFSCWEGVVMLPRPVFDATGGWADPFFYAHEGIELAWRVWDAGKRAWYAGELVAHHPVIQQTRHAYYWRLNARNRVWLARRNLPLPLIPLYVGSWTLVHAVRFARRPSGARAWLAGWLEGWRTDPGERRPIRWRTVWRMTLAGRPPVI